MYVCTQVRMHVRTCDNNCEADNPNYFAPASFMGSRDLQGTGKLELGIPFLLVPRSLGL